MLDPDASELRRTRKDLEMNSYVVGAARYEDGKLVDVAIQCTDEPEGPYLHECEEASVAEVIARIRGGDEVVSLWCLPGGGRGTIPLEIVNLPNGEESIEVVAQGQPEGYRMVNLPRLTTNDSATSGG